MNTLHWTALSVHNEANKRSTENTKHLYHGIIVFMSPSCQQNDDDDIYFFLLVCLFIS